MYVFIKHCAQDTRGLLTLCNATTRAVLQTDEGRSSAA